MWIESLNLESIFGSHIPGELASKAISKQSYDGFLRKYKCLGLLEISFLIVAKSIEFFSASIAIHFGYYVDIVESFVGQ